MVHPCTSPPVRIPVRHFRARNTPAHAGTGTRRNVPEPSGTFRTESYIIPPMPPMPPMPPAMAAAAAAASTFSGLSAMRPRS